MNHFHRQPSEVAPANWIEVSYADEFRRHYESTNQEPSSSSQWSEFPRAGQ